MENPDVMEALQIMTDFPITEYYMEVMKSLHLREEVVQRKAKEDATPKKFRMASVYGLQNSPQAEELMKTAIEAAAAVPPQNTSVPSLP